MVYYEARGEPFAGQIKVAAVAVNRARITGRHVCDIVNAHNQFSPYLTKTTNIPLERKFAQVVASLIALSGLYTTSATHFESRGNYLERRFKLKYIYTIGGHRFYEESCYNARCFSEQQPPPNLISTN
jgi:spore germination cell wall hydrolase CwlJ-like protein